MEDKISPKRLTDLVNPVVESLGYEMVEIEFVKESKEWYLRVYIDTENDSGITIDDCELVSKALSKELDEKDPIEQSYILEVSSPGIDRPLKKKKDFERFKDYDVEVRLYKPINGLKEFEGKLVGLIDENIVIISQEERLEFDKKSVAVVKLAVKF